MRRFFLAMLATGALIVATTHTASAAPDAGVDSAAAASSSTVTIFNATQTATSSKYFQPAHNGPTNLVPYTKGHAKLKLVVTAKPSSKPLQVQVCMWRNSYKVETCSPLRTITDEATYNFDLGAPATWWKKNGNFSWSTAYDVTRIMLKDPVSGKLMMAKSCGAYCYKGSDLSKHVPITMTGTLVFHT